MKIIDILRGAPKTLSVNYVKKGGWLHTILQEKVSPPKLPIHSLIEERANSTNKAGPRPLWQGYQEVSNYPRSTSGTRKSEQVRTVAVMGRFFTFLATSRRNPIIIEFGAAFGVSGMYWLGGIGTGHLYSFEPNSDWAAFARDNLQTISSNFTLTVDTFESSGSKVLQPKSADIAFVDAIHTSEFVYKQYEFLKPLMKPKAIILFDDINFSPDMNECWKKISAEPHLVASATIGDRVGIIELP